MLFCLQTSLSNLAQFLPYYQGREVTFSGGDTGCLVRRSTSDGTRGWRPLTSQYGPLSIPTATLVKYVSILGALGRFYPAYLNYCQRQK